MIKLEIISAEAKKAELEANRVAEELRKKQWEALQGQRVEKLTEQVFNKAKKVIEQSKWRLVDIVVTIDDLNAWGRPSEDELNEAIETVRKLLTIAGYKCENFYKYSMAWRTRSDKYGYLYVHID